MKPNCWKIHLSKNEAVVQMDAKRGYVPEDERNFSSEALETMKTASRHISFLINEGYDLKQATVFVGNHFLLSERQRLAIMRSLATDRQLRDRKDRQVQLGEAAGKEVWIIAAAGSILSHNVRT